MERKGWTLVVAGSYREFETWCQVNHVNPKMLHEARVRYASDASSVHGLPVSRVVYTGNWFVREIDLLEAVEVAERRAAQVVRS